jgi:hypothetical protein
VEPRTDPFELGIDPWSEYIDPWPGGHDDPLDDKLTRGPWD